MVEAVLVLTLIILKQRALYSVQAHSELAGPVLCPSPSPKVALRSVPSALCPASRLGCFEPIVLFEGGPGIDQKPTAFGVSTVGA